MRTYTEQEIRNAWNAVIQRHPDTPSYLFEKSFFLMLDAVKPKEKLMLFSKQDLLDVAVTGTEQVMIHGVFALLGMEVANEAALMSQARNAKLNGTMASILGLAKAKRDEDFQPGDVVRDADGKWYQRRKEGGTHPWVTFGNGGVIPDSWLKRPLEKR